MTIEICAQDVPLPDTLEQALDANWLACALAGELGGSKIARVETVEVLRTMATKVRFLITCENGEQHAFCIKAFLDVDELTARAGPTMLHEADFYLKIAPHVGLRLPDCVVAITDRENPRGLIIMRDLVAAGARFCLPHDDFTRDDVGADLEQFALLHANSGLLEGNDWIVHRVARLAEAQFVPETELQKLLDGPRGEPLPADILSARRLIAALHELARRDRARPQYLVHGDSHAGNLFRFDKSQPGIIDWQLLQRGGWSLDVAYHICATLPSDVAAREERGLLAHYLDTMRGAGFDVPDDETAWREYREAAAYGYYLWAMTRRVEPSICNKHVERLGMAVARHDSFKLLGV